MALTSPLPNNWCNNTVNISAHIHTAIDLLPKPRARGNPAAQRQHHPADDWHLLHLRLPFGWKAIWNHRAYGLYSKHHIVLFSLGAELVEHIYIRIHRGSREGYILISFPFTYTSCRSPAQSYYLKCHSGVTDTCAILMSWLVILEILIPDNALNQTVTQDSRLTPRVPLQPCDLWSIPLISNNFLQRTDTSVICHKCWDISEGKRLFFWARKVFLIIAQAHTDMIYREQ